MLNPEYAEKGWDMGLWKYTTIKETNNLVINDLMNGDKTILKLKGLEGSLDEYYFSNRNIFSHVNFNEPFEHNTDLLELITQYKNTQLPIMDKKEAQTNNIMLLSYICIPILFGLVALNSTN